MLNNVEGATRGSVSVAAMRVIWNVATDVLNNKTPIMKCVSPFDDTNHFEDTAFIMKSKAYC